MTESKPTIVEEVEFVPAITEEYISIEPEVEEEIVEVVAQEDITSAFVCTITEIKDLSTKLYLTVEYGYNNDTTTVVVSQNTSICNTDMSMLVRTSELEVGTEITVYSLGNRVVGGMDAKVIALGSSLYKFGYVKNTSGVSGDSLYKISLYNSSDIIQVVDSTKIVNAIFGTSTNVMNITEGSYILYTYDPNFKVSDYGNVYDCIRVLVLN